MLFVAPVAPVMSDDSSLCALPGCQRKKFTEGAKVFDFCGKKHASEARKKGIVPKQEQSKEEITHVQFYLVYHRPAVRP